MLPSLCIGFPYTISPFYSSFHPVVQQTDIEYRLCFLSFYLEQYPLCFKTKRAVSGSARALTCILHSRHLQTVSCCLCGLCRDALLRSPIGSWTPVPLLPGCWWLSLSPSPGTALDSGGLCGGGAQLATRDRPLRGNKAETPCITPGPLLGLPRLRAPRGSAEASVAAAPQTNFPCQACHSRPLTGGSPA